MSPESAKPSPSLRSASKMPLQVGFKRATETLRGITGLRLIEKRISVKDNKIVTYRVKFEVIFILE